MFVFRNLFFHRQENCAFLSCLYISMQHMFHSDMESFHKLLNLNVLPEQLGGLLTFAQAVDEGILESLFENDDIYQSKPPSWESKQNNEFPCYQSIFHEILYLITFTPFRAGIGWIWVTLFSPYYSIDNTEIIFNSTFYYTM